MYYANYKSWHIPRASLSSSSHSGQSSTDSIRNFDRRQSDVLERRQKVRKTFNEGPRSLPSSTASSASSINHKSRNKFDREKTSNMEKLHRGSRSSQGSSTDGISSLHSASSLLLSVANLENFTKMQQANSMGQPKHVLAQQNHLVLNINGDEPNSVHQQKTKDFDQVSIASSTHFTVVNGFGRSNIKPKSNSICRQSRQITILIVTMSVLFMIGILGAIWLMDRRARAMPEYHQ